MSFRISGNHSSIRVDPLTTATDGRCSAIIPHTGVYICHGGRVCAAFREVQFCEHRIVDAVTGAVLSHAAIGSPAIDTSGALLWRDKDSDTIMSSGRPDCDALPGVISADDIKCFRYGVCVVGIGDEWRLLRFDGDMVLDTEPDRKVRAVVMLCATWCADGPVCRSRELQCIALSKQPRDQQT